MKKNAEGRTPEYPELGLEQRSMNSSYLTVPVKLEVSEFQSAVALTPYASITSAAGTPTFQNAILPLAYRNQPDDAIDASLQVWLNCPWQTSRKSICLHPDNLGRQ